MKQDTGSIWQSRGTGTDNLNLVYQPLQSAFEIVTETSDLRVHDAKRFGCQAASMSKPNDPGNVFRARSASTLLFPAPDERMRNLTGSKIQRSNSLGAMELVRRHRKKVDSQVCHSHRNFSNRLHGIGMH